MAKKLQSQKTVVKIDYRNVIIVSVTYCKMKVYLSLRKMRQYDATVQGPSHTRHFCSRYCDKRIKRYFDKKIFFLQNIVMTFQNILNCPQKKFQYRKKILDEKCFFIFLSQYLFIFLSQYCVQKCLVCTKPKRGAEPNRCHFSKGK